MVLYFYGHFHCSTTNLFPESRAFHFTEHGFHCEIMIASPSAIISLVTHWFYSAVKPDRLNAYIWTIFRKNYICIFAYYVTYMPTIPESNNTNITGYIYRRYIIWVPYYSTKPKLVKVFFDWLATRITPFKWKINGLTQQSCMTIF